MKKLVLSLLAIVMAVCVKAQVIKADIFTSDKPVTWLGVDFTQLKFIGSAAQFKDAGEITNDDMRNKYFKGWNDLMIKEQSKYDVAGAVHRSNVTYAIDVARNANDNNKSAGYFSNNSADYHLLDETMINTLVRHYSFDKKTGIGMIMFVDGMDKENAKASVWVVFVDMSNKVVLLAKHMDEKGGGMGFRNYWAKAIYNALQDTRDDFKSWRK